jgi:hypothetical protein
MKFRFDPLIFKQALKIRPSIFDHSFEFAIIICYSFLPIKGLFFLINIIINIIDML